MKETLEYYYGLDIESIEELDGKYHFKIENQDYFFVFYNRGIEELEDIINVSNEMVKKGINVHKILINRNNSFLTKVGEYNYILFAVSNLNEEYDIFDMVKISEKLVLNNNKSNLYRNNWGTLWSEKIDYFEYQVRELSIEKDVVKNSFSYYVGMAENAISYVNNTNMKYGGDAYRIVLSHRRVFYPNYKLNYLNPLSFVFDLEVRDIAEYLKAMFFKKDVGFCLDELSSYLKIRHLSLYEYQMLYARLLYPTYYFDVYESVMNKNGDEEELVNIIKKCDSYEEFLKNAYLEISKYAKIDKIEWIINQH
jgi:spore coat-associated protein